MKRSDPSLNLLVIEPWNPKFPVLKLISKMVVSFPRILPLTFERML